MIRLGRATWLFAIVATLALSSCGGIGPSRTASGKAASTRLDATGVTRADVADGFDVKLAPGRPETAVVTYDDNLGDLLDVRVEGSTLRVHLEPHGHLGNPKLRVDVTVQRLESIHTAGGATVTTTGTVRHAGLQLDLSGGSSITAAVGVDRMSATLSGASRLTLTGTAGALTADGSGASDLALAELRLHDLDVQLSGASHADVQVDGTVAAQLSGASALTYRGNPRFIKRENLRSLHHPRRVVGRYAIAASSSGADPVGICSGTVTWLLPGFGPRWDGASPREGAVPWARNRVVEPYQARGLRPPGRCRGGRGHSPP